MRALGSLIGLLIVAAICVVIYKYYFSESVAPGVTTPVQTIDVVGVKNDLIAIGQAERIYQAEHGSYASLDDLVSSGAMAIKKSGRDGYTYDLEPSADGFRVTATCPKDRFSHCSDYAIDQTMEVQSVP
jgi:hypothetical protein